jgi:two-component system sensor histidine kinase HydH
MEHPTEERAVPVCSPPVFGAPSETRETRWPRWASLGVIAAPALAAVGLASTVLVARSGIRSAVDTLMRGEGEALLSDVRDDLRDVGGPPTSELVQAILTRRRSAGLRYVAVLDAHRGRVVEAGVGALDPLGMKIGELRRKGDRARLVENLPFPPGLPPPPPAGAFPPFAGEPEPAVLSNGSNGSITIELEAPVVARFSAAMDRTVAVGGAAVVVLVLVTLLLARSVLREAAGAGEAERNRRLVALGEMSAVMAHELRNPLASLKGHAQLLTESLSEGTRMYDKAARVVREAERIERLTNDLLELVRDSPVAPEAVVTRELVDRALDGLERGRVDVDLGQAPAEIVAHRERLSAAIGNLVRNALQSSGDAERVSVRVGAAGRAVVLEVRDHGSGLPKGEEHRIFEPFFTRRVRGTGLGLAVAQRAVEQHGGTLEGETHPGGGALFTIRLPNAVHVAGAKATRTKRDGDA